MKIIYFALPADLVALKGRAVPEETVAAAAAGCCLLTVDVLDEDDLVGVSDSSGPLERNDESKSYPLAIKLEKRKKRKKKNDLLSGDTS